MKSRLGNLFRFTIYLSIGLGILWLVYNDQNKAYQAKYCPGWRPAGRLQPIDNIGFTDFTQVHWQ